MIVKRSGPAEPSAGDSLLLAKDGLKAVVAPASRLEPLRRALARIEASGDHQPLGGDAGHFSLGTGLPAPALRRAALHEITAHEAGDGAATLAFALALALRAGTPAQGLSPSARLAPHGRILIVLDGLSAQETGMPYGHGLAGFGLDPGRLLLLGTHRPLEALWAIEEGLRCKALSAVVGIFARLPRAYDLTASRRLVLAARGGGLPACIAIIGEGGAGPRIASAAETRWRIAARPSPRGLAGEPTAPAFTAELLRRRGGEPATFDLDWNHDARCFEPAKPIHATKPAERGRPPLSLPVAAAPADRPGQAARAGRGAA